VGVGAAALSLVGCMGGGSDKAGEGGMGPKDTSGLLAQRTDTSKQTKPGGTWKSLTTADVTSFDPLTSPSFTTQVVAGYVYSRLLKVIPGILKGSTGDVEGDLAESWEVSADKLQITLKLRPNTKWDSRAPTSGRAVSADDVVFSWNKFAALHPNRADIANVANKDASILSVTNPDAKTVVVKLAFPDAAAVTMLASTTHMFVMPKEADGGFEPKNETRGSSAWVLEKYQSSQGFTYAKNPNWYRTDRPFLDKIDFPIVPEYASGLAQFKAGNIYDFAVKQEDVLGMKKDVPALVMRQGGMGRLWYNSWFGYDAGSPFKDERVRQAWSMSYDRDLFIQTFGATEQFTKVGLPVDMRWHSHLTSGLDGWWIDPKDEKAFGPNAKYFKFDPAEAKKLLTAAGFASGVETPAYYIATPQYGATFPNQAQIQIGFANDVGFKVKAETPDYQTRFLPDYYYGKGAFTGIAIGADNTEPDVGAFMFARFHPTGPRFKGFDPSGTDPKKGDPAVTALIEKIRQEFDPVKRKDIAKEYQQYMAKAMYAVPFPGLAAGFTLNWPAISNAGTFMYGSNYGGGTESFIHLWLDSSKAPVAKT